MIPNKILVLMTYREVLMPREAGCRERLTYREVLTTLYPNDWAGKVPDLQAARRAEKRSAFRRWDSWLDVDADLHRGIPSGEVVDIVFA